MVTKLLRVEIWGEELQATTSYYHDGVANEKLR